MPVTLEWHPSMPVLMSTYTGVLTTDDYAGMCHQRDAMISNGNDRVVLLADCRAFDAFPDAETTQLCDNIVEHEPIVGVVVVLDDQFYDSIARTMVAPEVSAPKVVFRKDVDAALGKAETWLTALHSRG